MLQVDVNYLNSQHTIAAIFPGAVGPDHVLGSFMLVEAMEAVRDTQHFIAGNFCMRDPAARAVELASSMQHCLTWTLRKPDCGERQIRCIPSCKSHVYMAKQKWDRVARFPGNHCQLVHDKLCRGHGCK